MGFLKLFEAYSFSMVIIDWIRDCITSLTFSVSMNDKDVGIFRSTRRLRQGCMMTPYLFIMVMQYLVDLFIHEIVKGHIIPPSWELYKPSDNSYEIF